MGAITSNNVASAIVKLVAADALPALVANLVMGNLVNRDYEPVLANAGDTINVPIPPAMQANNILEGGSEQKFIVVDAAAYSAWRQIPRFSEFQTAGDAGLMALIGGSVGKIKDFFVFRSQLVKKTGSSPVTTHNLAFTRDALGLVIRRLPQPLPGTGAIAEYAEFGNFGMRVVMSYQPNTLAQQFTVDILYG